MKTKIFFFLSFLLISASLFSQKDSLSPLRKNTIGIEAGNFGFEYSLFFKQDRGKWLYQLKAGYLSRLPMYDMAFHGNGYVIGGELNVKLNSKKNYPYYMLGLRHNNIQIDSVVYDDEMSALKYDLHHMEFSLINGLGYNWNFSRFNFSISAGVQLLYKIENKTNQKYLFYSDKLPPVNPVIEDKKTLNWTSFPALNFAFGYLF